jgi:Ca2+-binding EF-hand superfamily protein
MNRSSCLARLALSASRFAALAALALLAVTTAVGAADSDRTVSQYLDLNGDHRISYDEFVHSMAVKVMSEMDEDKNDLLTPSEVASSAAKGDVNTLSFNFSEIDSNGDGQVSLDELEQALRANNGVVAQFRKLDQDGDGFLSESELDSIDRETLLHATPQIRIQFP